VFTSLEIPTPTEIDRVANAYGGSGTTEVWYRYGFISHPLGYNWKGLTSAFATNAALGTGANWERKVDPLNLGILPVLHG
jgi:hypothetical protein